MAGVQRSWRLFLSPIIGLAFGFGLLLILFAVGCSHIQPETAERTFQGRVVYKDFEGGFYGILTEAGERLNPVNLPAECRQKGIRVRGTYRLLEGTMTIQMWGRPVELLRIICQESDIPGPGQGSAP